MTTLTQASQQWYSRPADERYTSLLDMQAVMHRRRDMSRQDVQTTRKLTVMPAAEPAARDLAILIEDGHMAGEKLSPTHMSFGQLCSLASTPSPASYFRESNLPAAYISDCLNWNLRSRSIEDIGLLGQLGDSPELRAATGPNYGRVWDAEVVDALVRDFGDGVSGDWRIPGEFGKRLDQVTKANTTLFASDRDMFVFLADEDRRIEVAGRNLARGFFVWNSEVGDKTLGLGFFLFDYVCCNRIVWGADQYTEVRVRHTRGAPDRWLEEVVPVLTEYSNGSAKPVMEAIERARDKKVGEDLDKLLANRFGRSLVDPLKAVHVVEEGRPIESMWDMTVAATAHARSIQNNDKRLEIERAAGELLAA
ncbi:MAG: DUF932 domain-containing protein [Patescibacteria group bacterium]|nr:DUF932 domain-containing protein [Patescibacteria group bacterium]